MTGCAGKTDDRFAAETYDEYTEPLTNAVIGTPTGVVTVGADGGPGAPPPSPDAAGGTGGGPVGSGSSGGAVGGGGSGGSSGGVAGDGGFAGDGGSVGEGGVEAEGGVDGGPSGGFGFWHFDDCSPTSNFLVDSSGEGANAQHALGASCVPGISGLGVQIRSAKDVIQVPDEPQFTVGPRVAVAAWVHPDTVSGNQPIVIKRLNNQTAFSLGIHNGNIEMSVVLTTGTTVISRAPIAAGTWTHVAGMFDGTFVFLFINGQQFGQVFGAGTIRNVFAPLRIGATTQSQHFSGIIDEVFVSTEPTTAQQLEALACITRPSTLTVTPATSGPVPFDTTVHYDVAVADNDVGFCPPKQYDMFFDTFDPNISTVFDSPPGQFQSAQPGATVTFGVEVTGSDSADPGVHQLPFVVDAFPTVAPFFEQLFGQLTYELAAPTGCFVFTRRELMITDTSVVDDPVRTFGSNSGSGSGTGDGGVVFGDGGVGVTVGADGGPAPSGDGGVSPSQGVWTFGHLIRELAPTPDQAPAMALQLFQHWLTDQTVNGFTVAARPAIQQVLLDIWPKTATGDLDLDQAPLRLQAIVNRIDIRNLDAGSGGEGRFVFAVNGPGFPQSFTVILEYNLPAKTAQDVAGWASRWHALSSHPFPSEEYNSALEALTRSFTQRDAATGAPPGLLSLRTNEIALSSQWELREFELSSSTGFFDENPLKETPDLSFNNTQTFAAFVNANAPAIEALVPGATGNTVPTQFNGLNFQAGSIINTQIEWDGPGIADPEARFHASINTCNGCHGPETGTFGFTMITPRFPGSEATLSPFLTGTTAFDDFTGQTRTLNDLARRRADLTAIVCGVDGGAPEGGAPPPQPDAGVIVPPPPPPPPPPLDASVSAD
ncbi:MAG TPA: LamG domain-containing protein [Polyangiaceae bacterium]|nr:LamG domain-containing protein [Polyangiaceae bacterium]